MKAEAYPHSLRPARPPATFAVSEDILVFAFRYALGRRTAAPFIVVDHLKRHWSSLGFWTREQICREAGAQCDEEAWREILEMSDSAGGDNSHS